MGTPSEKPQAEQINEVSSAPDSSEITHVQTRQKIADLETPKPDIANQNETEEPKLRVIEPDPDIEAGLIRAKLSRKSFKRYDESLKKLWE